MTRNFQRENGQPLQRMYLSCPIFLEKNSLQVTSCPVYLQYIPCTFLTTSILCSCHSNSEVVSLIKSEAELTRDVPQLSDLFFSAQTPAFTTSQYQTAQDHIFIKRTDRKKFFWQKIKKSQFSSKKVQKTHFWTKISIFTQNLSGHVGPSHVGLLCMLDQSKI